MAAAFRTRLDRAISSRAIRRGARAGSISACCTPRSTARAAIEGYAPCTVEDLKRFGYDYWALGHVHAAEIVSRDPWIVYPGNLQGRSVRETGPKGAMRVTVDDGRIVDVTPLPLDGARWAHRARRRSPRRRAKPRRWRRIATRSATVHAQGEGRPLAVRVTLTGATPLHNHLVARRETLQDEARACGFRFADDCWVEQTEDRDARRPPRRVLAAADALDVETLLARGRRRSRIRGDARPS